MNIVLKRGITSLIFVRKVKRHGTRSVKHVSQRLRHSIFTFLPPFFFAVRHEPDFLKSEQVYYDVAFPSTSWLNESRVRVFNEDGSQVENPALSSRKSGASANLSVATNGNNGSNRSLKSNATLVDQPAPSTSGKITKISTSETLAAKKRKAAAAAAAVIAATELEEVEEDHDVDCAGGDDEDETEEGLENLSPAKKIVKKIPSVPNGVPGVDDDASTTSFGNGIVKARKTKKLDNHLSKLWNETDTAPDTTPKLLPKKRKAVGETPSTSYGSDVVVVDVTRDPESTVVDEEMEDDDDDDIQESQTF